MLYKLLRRFFDVTLYKFTDSNGNVWRYTSSKRAITYAGEQYDPLFIKHGKVTDTQSYKKMPMEITVPVNSQLAQVFGVNPPDYALFVDMWHYSPEATPPDDTFKLYSGRLLSVKINNDIAKLTFVYDLATVSNNSGQTVLSIGCPLDLYGSACGANAAAFMDSYTLVSINQEGTLLQISPVPTRPNGWYMLGFVKQGAVMRTISRHVGDNLWLYGPAVGLQVGQPIEVYAGCDKRITTCDTKFNNLPNFGGCPYMPAKDIVNDQVRIA